MPKGLMVSLDTDPKLLDHKEDLEYLEMVDPSSLRCESLVEVFTMIWLSSILKDENGGYQTITE